jgi:phosphatidylglycerophosphatase A
MAVAEGQHRSVPSRHRATVIGASAVGRFGVVWKILGTFGFAGFFPVAPATFASFVFVLIYGWVPGGEVLAHPVVVLATLVAAVPASTVLEKKYGTDARCIVIDEIVGMQFVLTMASPTTLGLWAGFFLFRAFDVVKPFPARLAERLPRGYGIVADDVVAGIYARLALTVLSWIFSGIGRMI